MSTFANLKTMCEILDIPVPMNDADADLTEDDIVATLNAARDAITAGNAKVAGAGDGGDGGATTPVLTLAQFRVLRDSIPGHVTAFDRLEALADQIERLGNVPVQYQIDHFR